jgi:hypothetical protein
MGNFNPTTYMRAWNHNQSITHQTIFISPTVRLCDCPGLVFPSLVPKALQVILGSYPIAQTNQPYSVIQFLAERLDLPKLLKFGDNNKKKVWTTYDICEAWAEKRGYYTAKSNRLDVARAANHIMRMALEGRLTLAFRPPGYKEEDWAEHPDIAIIKDLLAMDKVKAAEAIAEAAEAQEGFAKSSSDEDSDDDCAKDDDHDEVPIVKNKFSALVIDDDE